MDPVVDVRFHEQRKVQPNTYHTTNRIDAPMKTVAPLRWRTTIVLCLSNVQGIGCTHLLVVTQDGFSLFAESTFSFLLIAKGFTCHGRIACVDGILLQLLLNLLIAFVQRQLALVGCAG